MRLILQVNAQNTTVNTTELLGWETGPDTRGTLNLVWTCATTIFACTWAVLHLNVPGIIEKRGQRLTCKIKWMMINVLFPEFILSKAICDLRLALTELLDFHKILSQRSPIAWTIPGPDTRSLKHEWRWKVKFPQHSGILYRLFSLELPDGQPTSESDEAHQNADVADKTGVGPGVTCELQRVEGPTDSSLTWKTTLEWTLEHSYYAQMGGLVYQDRACRTRKSYIALTARKLGPHFIWSDSNAPHPLEHCVLRKEDIEDKSKANWLVKGFAVLQITWIILSVIVRHINELPISQIEIATIAFSVMAIFIYLVNWWKPKDISQPTIIQNARLMSGSSKGVNRMQQLSIRLWSPSMAIKDIGASARDDLERVPNDLVWLEPGTPLIFVLLSFTSLVFGGLHCFAWNFEFPTQIELICWRVASLTSAILPMLTLGASLILRRISKSVHSRRILTLRSKLRGLEELPTEWWEHMSKAKTWEIHTIASLLRTPASLRNWDEPRSHKITVGSPIQRPQMKLSELFLSVPILLEQLRGSMNDVLRGKYPLYFQYSLLVDHWREEGGGAGFWHRIKIANESEDLVIHGQWDRELVGSYGSKGRRVSWLDLWREYEDFVMHKLNLPPQNQHFRSRLEQLVQAFAEALEEGMNISDEKLQRACTQASVILNVLSGVGYIASRLVIIVLLFTCLRATPAGVYEVTPWTKFIPSIS